MIGLRILAALSFAALCIVAQADEPASTRFVPPREMAASKVDVWGEAAMAHPDGPSYELFKDLLPPLRYVNTAFRHHPLVLSAPQASVKARWISNGSGINLRADKPPMWREFGIPIAFHVGERGEPFGQDLARIAGPKYVDGCLPIVQIAYSNAGCEYQQEAFAPVSESLASSGAVLVRFTARRERGHVVAKIGDSQQLVHDGSALKDQQERICFVFDSAWTWNAVARELQGELADEAHADLLVFTRPLEAAGQPALNYDDERKACVDAWQKLLARGTQISIPEPQVENAWRSQIVGNYMLAVGDRMNYSAGNAYDKLYEGECGDVVRALLMFGQTDDARRMIVPLLQFDRQATRFHVAGHKLQLLARYYWITRDAELVRETRPIWEQAVRLILDSRSPENGLLPRDNYAGDINEKVLSLNSNANCWRGLRDVAVVMDEIGEKADAEHWLGEAARFREAILMAVAKSERRDTDPPFIPLALLSDEQAHDPLTATRKGSYYDLMAPYILGSEVFGIGSDRETWMIEYLRQHGGLAMGMIRSMPHQGEFNGEPGVNVLYGLRYMLAQLRRGDRQHALVGFYGHLAHGMTRDTFIGGEGSRFFHGDEHGRSFYLPPNSASNAMFLTTLRYLLIQDWDLTEDGRPETLRLLDAIPPRWLADGTEIRAERAPTVFGEVSLRVQSRLKHGMITISIEPVARPPERPTLYLPDPPGYRVTGLELEGRPLTRDQDGRFTLPSMAKPMQLKASVVQTRLTTP